MEVRRKLRKLDFTVAIQVSFCEQLVLPKTVLAGKYIMLYRKLRENGGVIVQ